MKFVLLCALVFLAACKKSGEDFIPELIIEPGPAVTGIDINGEVKTCYKSIPTPDDPIVLHSVCPAVFGPGDQFDIDCRGQGYDSIMCDCSDYVCVGPFTGRDVNGDLRTCRPSNSYGNCTEEFGPGDQFAIDCKTSGNLPVPCGCHDYICVEWN